MTKLLSRRRFLGALASSGAVAALLLGGSSITASAQTLVASQVPAQAGIARSPKTVRLLTIGNSFSGDATRLLDELVAAAGHVLVYRTGSIGGGTMAQHWQKAMAHDRDSADPAGLYGSGRSLRQELTAEPWDFVTIQQGSIVSHNSATYRPYAGQLHGYVRALAPRAEMLVHQTWAYRVDDSRFAPAAPPRPGEPTTQREMYEGLTRAYDVIAAELGGSAAPPLRILPVGDAFFQADTDTVWGFKPDSTFNPKTAQKPALPDQSRSLHIGWQWRSPAKEPTAPPTLGRDGHHASVAGQYLAACVFFEVLFNESAEGNGFVPKGIDPGYARFLQKTAHAAVEARQKAKK